MILSAGNEDLRSCGLVPVKFLHGNCAVTEKVRLVPFLVSCAVPAARNEDWGLNMLCVSEGLGIFTCVSHGRGPVA